MVLGSFLKDLCVGDARGRSPRASPEPRTRRPGLGDVFPSGISAPTPPQRNVNQGLERGRSPRAGPEPRTRRPGLGDVFPSGISALTPPLAQCKSGRRAGA